MAYTIELRTKAVEAYNTGAGTQEEISSYFQIGLSTFKRWLQRKRAGEPLEPITQGKGRPKTLDAPHLETIKQVVKEAPSITLHELSELLKEKHKVKAGNAVICRALKQLNLRYKKLSLKAVERESDEVKKKEKRIYQR